MTARESRDNRGEHEPKAAGRRDEPAFEKALARLEKIVAEMEAGKLPLEEMIGRFEEGQTLIRFCTKKLNEVERKIEVLVKKGEDAVAVPFEEGAPESAGDEDAAAPAKEHAEDLF